MRLYVLGAILLLFVISIAIAVEYDMEKVMQDYKKTTFFNYSTEKIQIFYKDPHFQLFHKNSIIQLFYKGPYFQLLHKDSINKSFYRGIFSYNSTEKSQYYRKTYY